MSETLRGILPNLDRRQVGQLTVFGAVCITTGWLLNDVFESDEVPSKDRERIDAVIGQVDNAVEKLQQESRQIQNLGLPIVQRLNAESSGLAEALDNILHGKPKRLEAMLSGLKYPELIREYILNTIKTASLLHFSQTGQLPAKDVVRIRQAQKRAAEVSSSTARELMKRRPQVD